MLFISCVPVTVTIQQFDGTSSINLEQITLLAGERIGYREATGYTLIAYGGSNTVKAGDGANSVEATGGSNTVYGVSGKDRDTLQDVIAALKGKDFGIDMQFDNYRSN